MYKFIFDENELRKFYDLILPDLKSNEIIFVSLSARNKYLNEEEQLQYGLGRTEMFDRKIIHSKDWSKFLKTIRRFETNEGSYLTKIGKNIPEKCITTYININPSCVLKAYREFNNIYTDYLFELSQCVVNGHRTDNIMNRLNQIDHTLMTCLQKNRGTKIWLDIDFDVPKSLFNAPVEMKDYLNKYKGLIYYWIDTRSGYHLLINRSTLSFNPNDICVEGIKVLKVILENKKYDKVTWDFNNIYVKDDQGNEIHYEIIVNKNEMIPLPGTIAGGHKVRIL